MKRPLFKVLAFVAALLVGAWLHAAPPPNDNLASAQQLTGDSGELTVDTTEATYETVEEDLVYGSSEHTVWYKWTASKNCIASFDTFDSDFDTVLAVYTDINSEAIVWNDDYMGNSTSYAEFSAQKGQTYLIRVGGYTSSCGQLTLRWSFAEIPELTGESGAVTTDVSEGTPIYWYSWTAQKTGPARFNFTADGSSWYAEIAAYTNSFYVAGDDGTYLDFFAQAGQTYMIRAYLQDYEGDCKKLDLTWTTEVQDLTGDFGVVTTDVSEETHTYWYSWTAQKTGPAYFELTADGSDWYAELVAYTNFIYAAGGDDSYMEFCAQAGQTYLIRAKVWDGSADCQKQYLKWYGELAEGEWKIFAADDVVIGAVGDLPEDLKAADFPAGVTGIARGAFAYVQGVKFVTIPATVTNIGDNAFVRASDLAWVDYEGDVAAIDISDTAFRSTPYNRELPFKLILKNGVDTNTYWNAQGVYVTNYTDYCAVVGFVGTCPAELVIPEGVTRVKSYAFSELGNEGLTKVTFPSTLKSTVVVNYGWGYSRPQYAIEDYAFSRCDELEEVAGIPAGAKVSNRAFSDSLYERVRPFELATQEDYDFDGWDYERGIFTNVTVETQVLGFHGACPEEVTIPEGIHGISSYAFSLDGSGYNYYGDWRSAVNLKKLSLPSSLEYIDDHAFAYLPEFEEVVFRGKKDDIYFSDYVFYGTPYAQKQVDEDPEFELVTDYWESFYWDADKGEYVSTSNLWVTGYVGTPPESIVIPNGVYGIYYNALEGLEGFTSLTIPASVKEIDGYAFAYCSDLATVTFLGKRDEINTYSEYGLGTAFLGTPYSATLDFQVLYTIYPNTVWQYEPVYDKDNDSWDVKETSTLITNCYVYGYVGTCPAKLDLSQHLTNKWGYTSYDIVSFNAGTFADTATLTELVLPNATYYKRTSSWYWVYDEDGERRPYIYDNYYESKAFRNCANLVTVTVSGPDANNKEWLTDTFRGTPWLDGAVAFEFVTEDVARTNITSVVNEGVNCCTPYAERETVVTNVTSGKKIVGFYGNVPAKLEFPADVDEIDSNVFEECDSITEVVVPGNVKTIGYRAFAKCANLQNVEFKEGVEYIGWSLFYGCGDGMQVIVPASAVVGYYYDNTDEWRGGGFSYAEVFHGIDGDVDVLAPRTTSIYDRAFYSSEHYGYNNSSVRTYYGRTCVEYYTHVVLDADGGTFEGEADYRCFDDVVTGLPTPVLAGNVFREWWDERGNFYRNGDVWDENAAQVYLTAEWATEKKFYVYGLDGPTELLLGDGDDYETLLRVLEDTYGAEPEPSRHGLTFLYWTVDGEKLNHRSVIGANSTFGAFFDEFNPLTGKPDAAVDATAAQTYDGYILDYKGNNAGTIQVKVGKPSKKTGEASVSAKVQMFGTAKVSFKADPKGKWKIAAGEATKGVTLSSAKAKDKIVIDISEKGVFGTYGDYDIIGSRNTSKKDAAYAKWSGKKYDIVFKTKEGTGSAFTGGYSGVTVSIANKGKVKISGVMADGAKVNATAQLLISDKGEGCVNAFIPMYTGKKGGFGFVLWIEPDGTTTCVESISTWTSTDRKAPFTAELELVGSAAPAPSAEMSFALEKDPEVSGATVLADFLPRAVKAAFSGTKITVAKANKVKVDKASGKPTRTAAGRTGATDNDAGLKLTYAAKTGSYKGSFTVYTLSGGKLKKVRATVNGTFVGGVGYGTAVIKDVGSYPVTLR